MAAANGATRVVLLSRSRPDGVMARRAHALATRSASELNVTVVHRQAGRLPGLRLAQQFAPGVAPEAIFVFDSSPRELGPSFLQRLRGVPLIVEAGDVAADLLVKLA